MIASRMLRSSSRRLRIFSAQFTRESVKQCSQWQGQILSNFFMKHIIERNFSFSSQLSAKKSLPASVLKDVLVLDEDDNEMQVMKWTNLEKMAAEKKLKILCIDETHKPHPIYQLVSNRLFLESTRKKSSKSKTKDRIKLLTLKSNISENDLKIKLEQMRDWLNSNYIVRARITFSRKQDDQTKFDTYKEIVKALSNIASVTKSKTEERQISLEICLTSSSVHSESVPPLLKLEELKAIQENNPTSAGQKSSDGHKEKVEEVKK